MKKIFAILLVFVVVLSLCACADEFITPDGEVVEKPENGDVIFEHECDKWVISKLNESSYYAKGYGHKYSYSMVVTCEEYACYVPIALETYVTLNNGDILSGKFVDVYVSGYNNPIGKFIVDEDTQFSECECYAVK